MRAEQFGILHSFKTCLNLMDFSIDRSKMADCCSSILCGYTVTGHRAFSHIFWFVTIAFVSFLLSNIVVT